MKLFRVFLSSVTALYSGVLGLNTDGSSGFSDHYSFNKAFLLHPRFKLSVKKPLVYITKKVLTKTP